MIRVIEGDPATAPLGEMEVTVGAGRWITSSLAGAGCFAQPRAKTQIKLSSRRGARFFSRFSTRHFIFVSRRPEYDESLPFARAVVLRSPDPSAGSSVCQAGSP